MEWSAAILRIVLHLVVFHHRVLKRFPTFFLKVKGVSSKLDFKVKGFNDTEVYTHYFLSFFNQKPLLYCFYNSCHFGPHANQNTNYNALRKSKFEYFLQSECWSSESA